MSEETSRESRLLAVKALASLPLFQLSTAGMELFHTNMLYWLATERPAESIAVWNTFGLPGLRINPLSSFIRREWRHIDLVISPGDGQPALVIENKIGAIPTPAQLDRYCAGLRSARPPFDPESAEYVLLTVTPPSFALPKPWRSITYRELLPALREAAQKLAGADAALIDAYTDMIGRLNAVATAYDPARDLDGPIALLPDERHLLNESRLLSLVEKVRAGRFAEIATNLLTTELGEVGQIDAGFSNGSGIIQWFVLGPAGRLFGWQIQGGQFRLAVITGKNDPRPKREALVASLYESYFDFSPPGHLSHVLSPHTSKKQWLGYSPSFVYRYEPLAPGTTWNELLVLVEWFSRHTLAFVANCRRTIACKVPHAPS